MKRKLLLFLSFFVTMTMMAGPVTKDEAAQKAQAFINGKNKQRPGGPRRVKLAHRQMKLVQAVQENALYYVFNVGEEDGFVIVSGDDRTPAVLGYTDNGSFSTDQMPDNMRAWLQGYADQIAWLQAHPEEQNTIQKAPTKNVVYPLMSSQWDQDEPYWNDCPTFVTGNRSVTGCVATAMAQVMYYHQWPNQTKQEIPSYTYGSRWGMTITENAVPVTTFDWNNMLPVYTTSATAEQNAAVAALMHCCGTSVKMDYADESNDGSSASSGDVAAAMKTYFDYSATTRFVGRGNYTLYEWNDLIYSELAENRPVFYSGQSSGGGHAFVVDGYDGDELFHVNWGWGGFRDGYFLLSVLNPGSTAGIGASSSNDGYSFGQDAVIGIQPNHGEEGEEEVGASLTFSGASISGSTITFADIRNNNSETYYFNFGIGIVDENGNITSKSLTNGNCPPSNFFKNISFPVNTYWGNGTYKVIPISRVGGTSKWIPGMNYEKEYFEVVINGSSITITHIGAPNLSVTSFSFPGEKKASISQSVDVIIKNNGDEFYGPLYLFASTTNSKGSYQSRSGVTILEGRSFNTQFTFTPSAAGTYNIWIATDASGNNVIGQSSVVIEAASTETYSLSAQGLSIENGNPSSTNGGNIYGTRIKGTFSLKNTGTSTFGNSVTIRLYKFNGTNYSYLREQVLSATIAAGETKAIEFDFNNLEKTRYLVVCLYGNSTTQYPQYSSYTLMDGVEIFMADGSSSSTAAQSNVTAAVNVAAINLTGVSGVTSVTGGNPNTLFIFGENDNVPASLAGRNVVKGSTAASIVLKDGYDFYSPVTFTATEATYTRTFAAEEGLTRDYQNWSTLTLPFDVSSVTVELNGKDYPIDWFHSSSDSDKNFWVMDFGSEENGVVNFGHAQNIAAGRPCLLAVPGAAWGNANDLTGLPITFRGSNVSISGDFRAATTGDNYKMKGVVAKKTQSNIYVLNAAGNAFTRENSATVDAFRAYFEPTSTAANASMLMMAFGGNNGGGTTGLGVIDRPSESNRGWYSLDGQKLNGQPVKKGIYIVNGKKVVIK